MTVGPGTPVLLGKAPAIMVPRLPENVTRENGGTFEQTIRGMLLFVGQLFGTIVRLVSPLGR